MTIKNKQELASDSAEIALVMIAQRCGEDVLPRGIFESDESGDMRYTEEAQDIFNELYGVYEDLINEHTE